MVISLKFEVARSEDELRVYNIIKLNVNNIITIPSRIRVPSKTILMHTGIWEDRLRKEFIYS